MSSDVFSAEAVFINESSEVVGWAMVGEPYSWDFAAFAWVHGSLTSQTLTVADFAVVLPEATGFDWVQAIRSNDAGQVAGRIETTEDDKRLFVWDTRSDTVVVSPADFPPANTGGGINASGTVSFDLPWDGGPAIWNPDTGAVKLCLGSLGVIVGVRLPYRIVASSPVGLGRTQPQQLGGQLSGCHQMIDDS